MMRTTDEQRKPFTWKSVLNVLIALYVFSYVLPSGDMGKVPVQNILIFLLLAAGGCALIRTGKTGEVLRRSLFEAAVCVSGLLWCVISFVKGCEWSITFGSLLYITVVVFLVICFLVENGLADAEQIIRVMLAMILVRIAGKLLIELAFILKMIVYEQVGQLYRILFGTEASTMTMYLGPVQLVRLQSASDGIIITLLPFYWLNPRIKKSVRGILFLLGGVYTMLVFSRIYLAQYAFFALLGCIYYRKKIPKKIAVTGGALILVSAVFWLEPVISVLKFRFFSSFAVESDSIRSIQSTLLWEGIKQSPVWGHGMGSYLQDYIRNGTMPFSYEKEYLSFLYQLGIAGFLLLIVGNMVIYCRHLYEYWKKSPQVVKLFSVCSLLWIWGRPFFNPSFLGIQNGFPIIGILLLLVYYSEKNEEQLKKDDKKIGRA